MLLFNMENVIVTSEAMRDTLKRCVLRVSGGAYLACRLGFLDGNIVSVAEGSPLILER